MCSANSRNLLPAAAALALTLALSACGGGGGGGGGFGSSSSGSSSSSSSSGGSSSSSSSSSGGALTEAMRITAASSTATSTTNGCSTIRPFYWEIGDGTASTQPRAGGTVDTTPASGNAPNAATVMPLYSASKWLFSSYVVQLRGGNLSASDAAALNMTSGYDHMNNGSCTATQSVAECDTANNGSPDPAGTFHYNSGHFQHLGAGLAIGIDHNAALKTEMDLYLPGLSYVWDTPELAGGASDSAGDYASFLRQILNGSLPLVKTALGTHAALTNPTSTGCTSNAQTTCVPGAPFDAENLHYSLGHWVEDDPTTMGDGAYSSPGIAGFYPWIDSTKTWYGIIARNDNSSTAAGFTASITCGRLIRRAWLTGIAQ